MTQPERSTHQPGPRDLTFRKSSYSGANGQCVEVAGADGSRWVRDSKNPLGDLLHFTDAGWTQFLRSMKTGTFD
ncbi:protein of unknown function [Saccharopolyspora antimicrobica]|uniref:Uncharacterized protein DUF397 n=1 Tax=Saccharopolyspora antimicrobica TaxID=455193 RepID=A0A1I5AWH8_9PSEU|nr:DUF397 domain-containing protein [Saccharopolyspora antimicrobica]RKT86388.1 uncharacterized protein DUF397 [Saccharopolyspora antimicrobica]SFN66762.1 protein of unknown function [Saccharopolyspora antimicrobica]